MVGGLVASVDTVGVLPSVTEYVGWGVLRGWTAAAVEVVVVATVVVTHDGSSLDVDSQMSLSSAREAQQEVRLGLVLASLGSSSPHTTR